MMQYRSPTRHDIGKTVEVSRTGDEGDWHKRELVEIAHKESTTFSCRFNKDDYAMGAPAWCDTKQWLFCRVPYSTPDPIAELSIAADWLAERGMDEAARVLMLHSGNSLFMVSSGSYSDYSVKGVFSSRDLAENYMQTLGGMDWNEIEEVDINSGFQTGLRPFSVRMDLDGNTSQITDQSGQGAYFNGFYARIIPVTRFNPSPVVAVECWARDEQHAVKIANEQRAMLIAQAPNPPEPQL